MGGGIICSGIKRCVAPPSEGWAWWHRTAIRDFEADAAAPSNAQVEQMQRHDAMQAGQVKRKEE